MNTEAPADNGEIESNEIQSESARLHSAGNSPNWSLLGFELFDLIVIAIQAAFFLLALPMDSFFLHPATKFFSGMGFFTCLFFLGRTRQYTLGYKQINGIHGYLHFATSLGGFMSGIIVCVFIILPIGDFARYLNISEDLMTFLLVLPALFFAVMMPYLANRANESDEQTEYVVCPQWLHLVGRGFMLITANVLLLFLYNMMKGEMEDDLLGRSILASWMMAMFYIPVRVQEMFLRPNGPHFQSLIQTTIALILCGTLNPLIF